MTLFRRRRCAEEREDVESHDGAVTFNYLQQREPEPVDDDGRPSTETTDPWGITESGQGS